jgi:tetratricopeptide (TPR) repeat protein
VNPKLTISLAALVLWPWFSPAIAAQSRPAARPSRPVSGVEHALDLAEKGDCRSALPVLARSLKAVSTKELKFQVGIATARCAMSLNELNPALEALAFLNREFPRNPQVLYMSTHYFSELANRSARELATTSPHSTEALELDAEAYEAQGKWDEAAKEYEMILKSDPSTPGIHYRLGRIILSKPQSSTSISDAKAQFEAELKLHPHDAPSEFMLGDIARQSQQWDQAADHFSKAAKIDESFSEAYLGLGMALNAESKFSEAVMPLEKYVKMEPSDPAGHYQLAIAYARSGRQQDAARQMALQHEADQRKGSQPTEPQ